MKVMSYMLLMQTTHTFNQTYTLRQTAKIYADH